MIKDKRKKGSLRNKAFSEYSERSKRGIKNQLKLQVALNFLGLYELIPTKVEYCNHLERSYETKSLIDEHELMDSFVTEEVDELTNDQLDNVSLSMYVVDKFQISDKACQELSFQAKDLPSTYSIEK